MQLFFLAALTQMSVAAFAPYLQIILRNKGYSHSLSGAVIALLQVAMIIVPMVLSSISDRRGRTKPFLLLSGLLSLVSAIPFILSRNILLVCVSGFVMNGFFWCLNPMVDGFVSRGVGGDSAEYGKVRSTGTMVYVLVLTLFGVTGFPHENDNASILISMAAALSIFIIGVFFIREDKREAKAEKELFSLSVFPRRFILFLVIAAFTRFSQTVCEKLLSSYMTENLALGSSFSYFVALGALSEFGCMLLFGRLLSRGKLKPWTVLLISSVSLALRLWLYLIPGIPFFVVAQLLHGLTFGAFHVCVTAYVSDNIDPGHAELAMTLYWALATNLPQLVSSLLGGVIIERYGYSMLFSTYSVFPLIAVALCFVFRSAINGEKK